MRALDMVPGWACADDHSGWEQGRGTHQREPWQFIPPVRAVLSGLGKGANGARGIPLALGEGRVPRRRMTQQAVEGGHQRG